MSSNQTNRSVASDTSPLISIIIPAYKVAPFIRETLDSVFAQSFTDFEVIVINDGSPDTQQLEREIKHYQDRIIYLVQVNQGAGAARNAGLRLARGQYVAFLDGDDVWLPEFLSNQLTLIRSEDGYDLVYADAINFGDHEWSGRTSMESNPSFGKVTFDKLISGESNIVTSTVLASRALVVDLGGFDENFPNSQDFDLWLRLAKDANARITYQRQVLARRRLYAGSLASDPVRSFDGELRVLNKVRLRDDLTPVERAAVERTIPLRSATANVIRGKQALAKGDFASSIAAFKSAQDYLHSWKLRLVLAGIHTAPELLRYWVRSRARVSY